MPDDQISRDEVPGGDPSSGASVADRAGPQGATSEGRSYTFLRSPFWLFSHVFVSAALCLFVAAALWQLGRWDERKETNVLINSRADAPAVSIDEALAKPADELDFVRVEDSGSWIEANLIRVANRSHNGEAGDWMVGVFETDDGQTLLVNRGFVTRTGESRDETGHAEIAGWLRLSHQKETFGATDNGVSERVPRFDVAAIADRFDLDVVPVWLQHDNPTELTYPISVPLPERTNGSHFSYAVQWTIFTILTAGAYVLIIRRKALGVPEVA